MPTYEYRCESGHQYEKREGFDAPARQKCPTCRKTATRLLFAPPVVFKGGGFYATDSRGSSGSDSEPASPKPAADSHSHGDGHGHSHDAPAAGAADAAAS